MCLILLMIVVHSVPSPFLVSFTVPSLAGGGSVEMVVGVGLTLSLLGMGLGRHCFSLGFPLSHLCHAF